MTDVLKVVSDREAIDGRPSCATNPPGLEPPPKIKCPCGCVGGVLRLEGLNIHNTLAFLVCSICSCCYEADVQERKL